jgi:phosphatidylglycerol lysyltransferase
MRSTTDVAGAPGWGAIRTRALGVLLVLGAVWLLWDRERAIDPSALWAVARDTRPWQWLAALALTALSFLAIARYDRLVHGWLGTGISERAAARSGMAAIAVSQMAGMGLITGTLVRWRCLPGLGAVGAARVTAVVAVSFMAGWAAVTALAVAVVPFAPVPMRLAALGLLLALAAALILGALLPRRGPLRHLPGVVFMGRAAALVAFDTAAAALALAAFAPDLAVTDLATAYLVALGAGLVAATPGGLGPFELTMLELLPDAAPEPLLAAILCFRVVYHAIPAALAVLFLLAWPRLFAAGPGDPATGAAQAAADPATADPATADRAEAALLRQPGHRPLHCPRTGSCLGTLGATPQGLVLLGAPWRKDRMPEAAAALVAAARREARLPLAYKIGPRCAARLRRRGWAVLALSQEALVTPAAHDPASPACRTLRRKLRKARAAGVEVSLAGDALPLEEMAAVAAGWAAAHGGERGFSMGRFDPSYVAAQQVWLARKDGRLVAFVSLHRGGAERTLDLIRHTADAPDGTVHLLVDRAIAAARADGVPRLSLAAAPLPADGPAPAALVRAVRRICRDDGLRRFKQGFAPRWEPLYIAAPSWPALALGAADIARAIAARPPARGTGFRARAWRDRFAPAGKAWHHRG